MARALVAGCGDVGGALAQELARDGHQVFALRRREADLPDGVEWIAGDLTDARELTALPLVDVVFYTAAPDAGDEESYEAVYVKGLSNLLEALSSSPPRRLLFTSSTSVYGQDDGSLVDESSPTEPREFRGRVLLRAERLAREASSASVILRLGGIYGPGRTGLLDRARVGSWPAGGRFLNLVHRDDAAAAMKHLAGSTAASGIYLGVDCEPVESLALFRWLAERSGALSPLVDEPTTGRTSNKRCSNRRLLESGFRFRFPTYREGFAPLLESP